MALPVFAGSDDVRRHRACPMHLSGSTELEPERCDLDFGGDDGGKVERQGSDADGRACLPTSVP